ncbi:MAG: chromosome segregation protein SMC, partial [Clostridia bacterium]|nr:chromosome segregation protein SMC [Clostridia bacterium]
MCQLENSRSELDRLYKETEELSGLMHEKDAEIERIREELIEVEAQSSSFDNDLAVCKTNLKNNSDNILRIENEIVDQAGREGGIKTQIDAKKLRIGEIEQLQHSVKKKLDELMKKVQDAALQSSDIETKIDALTVRRQAQLEAASEFDRNISALLSANAEMNSRKESVKEEIGRKSEDLKTEEDKAKALHLELRENQDKLESLFNASKGFELKMRSREKKVSEFKELQQKTCSRLDFLRNRLQMLLDLEKDYEGFSKSVKMVMQQKEHGALRNIHGPVSRLIRTSDQYTVAVEIALGGSIQSIVVDREEDAKAAIGYLKSNDSGRATFLPLAAIRGQELIESGLANEDGFIGLGHELCEFDPKYTEIMKNLLGRTAIVNHIDTAIRMARKYHYKFKIVTLDGQVMNYGGAMTGGSIGRNAGILSRASEIERLSKEVEEKESERKEQEHT